MRQTSLCYIEKDRKYLMLHRNKKENDVNEGKWVGVGGGFEEGESPEECVVREVYEETGLTLTQYRYCGIITFTCDDGHAEQMHLFHATEFGGELKECDEGTLAWIDIMDVTSLPMWEGDVIFIFMMERKTNFFSLKLTYSGDKLSGAVLNGKRLK